MMHCGFDGTFDGLLTVAFDTYRERAALICVIPADGQENFLPDRQIITDPEKAERIRAFLQKTLGQEFLHMVRMAYLSRRDDRHTAIVKTIHRACVQGRQALASLDDDVLAFLACQREVGMEAHRFMGLLRFRQMTDGSMLAVFRPRNNVLGLLMPHFSARFPKERLVVYDEGRHLAGLAQAGHIEIRRVEAVLPQDAPEELLTQELWRLFFDTLAIQARKNPRLQRQNMPKYTWQHLTEMQG
ncbi:MAG: DNA metabolism protein [Clostridiales bacterium]|nr:DNA metabolism protein [Clostridiales bacterium]